MKFCRAVRGDRAEDARAARVQILVDDDNRVVVEAQIGTVVCRRIGVRVRTTTARTTSPFLTVPPGLLAFP